MESKEKFHNEAEIETEKELSNEEQEKEGTEEISDSKENNSSEKKKKSLFHKKEDKKDEQIKELQDKYTRQLAEFENFRKRNETEKSKMYDVGAKDVIEKIAAYCR